MLKIAKEPNLIQIFLFKKRSNLLQKVTAILITTAWTFADVDYNKCESYTKYIRSHHITACSSMPLPLKNKISKKRMEDHISLYLS